MSLYSEKETQQQDATKTIRPRGNRHFLSAPIAIGIALGTALSVGVTGCHKTPDVTAATDAANQNGPDPAAANLAPVTASQPIAAGQPARVLGQRDQSQPQQQGEDYAQQPPAPIERQTPDQYAASPDQSAGQMTDAEADALYNSDLTDQQASEPPPPLPEYDQPPAPEPDYLWTPGYWGYGPGGYYWVPGAWAGAPYAGALWTPGYWGFIGGFYRFHHGYWGRHIGYYGGIDYGYGYVGHGYYGGYWNNDHFFYNQAVNRVNVTVIHNVYNRNVVINNVVVNNRIVNRTSFNGGRGGLQTRPIPAEAAVLHEQRTPPLAAQAAIQHEASQNKAQFFNENHGRPAVAVAAHAVATEHIAAPPPSRQEPAIQARPEQPVQQARPAQPQNGFRPEPGHPEAVRPDAARQAPVHPEPVPQIRNAPQPQPNQVAPNQGRPNPENRPVQPEPQVRPAPENRPVQPQPQFRPAPAQPTPVRPAPEARPTPPVNQPRPEQVRPEQQARPEPQVRPQTPPPAAHPQPEVHPQPQAHPAPPPHQEEKPQPHNDPKRS
jgi:hypothetical protein